MVPTNWFRPNPQIMANEDESEFGQTRVRLIMLVVILAYILVTGGSLEPTPRLAPWAQLVVTALFLYSPFAVLIFFWARLRPGHYPARRVTSMVIDYGFLGFGMLIAPIIMMPMNTVILWITLGHGLRYGKRYLWIATAFALTTIFSVFALAPQTGDTIYILITLVLSVVAIPHYANSLLGRVEQARSEAEQANLAKSRFLAQASHDLRQPLHAINLFLASLQQTGLRAGQKQIVDRIDRSLLGVANLFRSLLDVSTLDSGAIHPNMESVNLSELLSDIVLRNADLAHWAGSDLRLAPTQYVVHADRALLETMVQNLVSNALKFSEGKSILVGCRLINGKIAIQVWDRGDGISEENLPFIFDEFFQVRKAGDKDRQGVGLGLAIVARVAKLLELEPAVRSKENVGSCFSIKGLRRVPPSSQLKSTQISHDVISPLSSVRILLVEDDTDILAATADLIRGWGCEVTVAKNIPDRCGDLDLIITDFDLGYGTTGIACIEQVRRLVGRPVPAIIVTGHDENRINGAVDDPDILILKKPLHPAEMRSAISALCMIFRINRQRIDLN
jgi:signal transduction histidine kinase/CheY-like chemotaxis protein